MRAGGEEAGRGGVRRGGQGCQEPQRHRQQRRGRAPAAPPERSGGAAATGVPSRPWPAAPRPGRARTAPLPGGGTAPPGAPLPRHGGRQRAPLRTGAPRHTAGLGGRAAPGPGLPGGPAAAPREPAM